MLCVVTSSDDPVNRRGSITARKLPTNMRKRLCCLLFVIASCVTQGTAQDQQGRREAGVRAVIAKFADARNTHDLQALVALYADDAESIGPTGALFARG